MDVKDIKFTADNMVEIIVMMSVEEYKEMYDGLLTQIYNEEVDDNGS